MKISITHAKEYIMDVLKAGLVPMLKSSPGLGKSSIAHEIAKDNQLKVIDLRLSQCDPSDLLGFPTINEEKTKSGYVPMSTFPIETDQIPEGYKGWLLLLDEFNSAPLSVQASAYKVVLDKQVGEFNLHPKVAIIAAGNLSTDKAIVNRLSSAMESRLIHFTLEVDNKAWMDWASKNGIDYRIISYINFKPDILHKFDPNHNDDTFACPRTWEFLSKIIKEWPIIEAKKIPVLAGTLSEGVGREFYSFCQIFQSLPTISQLINNPNTASVPKEPSTLYAITGLISNHLSIHNVDNLMKYVHRLPIEFQVITLQIALKKNVHLLAETSIKEWITINSQELL